MEIGGIIEGCLQGLDICTNRNCENCGFHEDEHARRVNLLKENGLSVNAKGQHYLNIAHPDESGKKIDPLKVMAALGFSREEIAAMMEEA